MMKSQLPVRGEITATKDLRGRRVFTVTIDPPITR